MTSLLFSDDICLGVRVGQPVSNMRLQKQQPTIKRFTQFLMDKMKYHTFSHSGSRFTRMYITIRKKRQLQIPLNNNTTSPTIHYYDQSIYLQMRCKTVMTEREHFKVHCHREKLRLNFCNFTVWNRVAASVSKLLLSSLALRLNSIYRLRKCCKWRKSIIWHCMTHSDTFIAQPSARFNWHSTPANRCGVPYRLWVVFSNQIVCSKKIVSAASGHYRSARVWAILMMSYCTTSKSLLHTETVQSQCKPKLF